jgi:XTP/dITP diphosphohydrolase
MDKTYTIALGTRNPHKVAEIREKLRTSERLRDLEVRLEVRPLSDFPDAPEVVEDRDTFEGNAVKKACELARALGLPVMADDSGLQVDALGGEPGVLSARYSGTHGDYAANNEKVLREMRDVPEEKRTARPGLYDRRKGGRAHLCRAERPRRLRLRPHLLPAGTGRDDGATVA